MSHKEIICSSRQNCANLGVQRAVLVTIVLPMTGIFLCVLTEKVVISLPKGQRNLTTFLFLLKAEP